jgi:Uma2 family endonuclease
MATAPQRQAATLADFLARPEDDRVEFVRGTLVEKSAVTAEHAAAQLGTGTSLVTRFQYGHGGPGGWWFFTELDVQFGTEVFRPDICGYRRERMPARARGRPVTLAPDWVCEILSISNEPRDRVEKLATYFRFGVPHYWIINPVEGIHEVFRRTDLAYSLVLTAHRDQRIKAEPFDAAELSVDELLGADPDPK